MNEIKKNESGFGAFEGLLVIIIIVLIGAAGWFVYKNHAKATSSTPATSIPVKTTTPITTDSSSTTKATPTTDEQVITALTAYCEAAVDPSTKKPFVLTVGTTGANHVKVAYSSDKTFAYVNAVCSSNGTTEGSGSAYYLKKVNDIWVFLYSGQMSSPEMTQKFNIPSDFN